MEPGASVAEYHIAGRADDTRFAEAARLGDVVTAALPDAKIVHHCVHPADWESFSRRLGATLGLPESALAAPIVWSHGRHIGDHTAWAARVQDRYGLTLDVGPDDVRRLAADHLERAEGKRASTMATEQRTAKRALVLVDLQNDFCAGGSLEVPDSTTVIHEANALRREVNWDLVVLTQDFHPSDHVSFASNNPGATPFETRNLEGIGEQIMWPDHCVQGTPGCEFHPLLERADGDVVVRKGLDKRVDSYSGFGDAWGGKVERTELQGVLQRHGVEELFICGLALDVCVAFTCLDAAKAGFKTWCLLDASRGIGEDTIAKKKAEMEAAGVSVAPAWREVLPRK